MKLITERIDHVKYLEEEDKSTGKRFMFIEGIFMQSIPNKNGRIYPEKTLHEETRRYIREKVDKGCAWGELGHPDKPTIIPANISHKIDMLRIEGKNIYGKARLTDTPNGNIARALLESGGILGVSSRGLGSLKKLQNGLNEVQTDFRIVTPADIVTDPSAPDAFVSGIMENVEWFFNESTGEWVAEQATNLQKNIKKLSKRQLEESKLRIFKTYLAEIARTSAKYK